jgi:P27 family predicted phage terminase small subunit
VVRLIQGNAGKRPIISADRTNSAVSADGTKKMPRCPSHLDAEARRVWRELAPQLYSAGLLTQIDGEALAAYCSSWSIWVQAKRKIAEEGLMVTGPRGGVRPSPWIAIARGAQRDLQSLAAEFGLSPLSRQRIHVVPPPAPDPFEELINS